MGIIGWDGTYGNMGIIWNNTMEHMGIWEYNVMRISWEYVGYGN
jgi:hypothetical protein